jgi:hypothetical protein
MYIADVFQDSLAGDDIEGFVFIRQPLSVIGHEHFGIHSELFGELPIEFLVAYVDPPQVPVPQKVEMRQQPSTSATVVQNPDRFLTFGAFEDFFRK